MKKNTNIDKKTKLFANYGNYSLFIIIKQK